MAPEQKPTQWREPVGWPQHEDETARAFGDRLNFLSPEAQHLEQGGLVILPKKGEKT